MTTKKFLGVDPGKSGGLACIDEKESIVEVLPIPTLTGAPKNPFDIAEIYAFFERHRDAELCFLEKGFVKGGVTSKVGALSIGFGCGILETCCVALGIPYQVLSPTVWQKSIFAGMSWKKNTKGASILFAKRAFPSWDMLASPRCTKPHDGMTDAVCIALHAKRTHT